MIILVKIWKPILCFSDYLKQIGAITTTITAACIAAEATLLGILEHAILRKIQCLRTTKILNISFLSLKTQYYNDFIRMQW